MEVYMPSQAHTRALSQSVAAYLLLAVSLFAQVDTGTITGTLRDPSGAVIIGASVTIANEDTGAQAKVTANSLGLFVSPPLRPGRYTVTAEMAGFRRTSTSVILSLNQRAVVDLTLPVGAVEEQVTVEARTPILETETSTVGNLRDGRSVRDLPLNTRNFNQLIGLTTGVVPAQTQSGSPALTAVRGTTANSVNGLGFRSNNFLVDGVDNSENHNGQGILIYPPVDAIQEFRVQTSVANAEFGRGGGGTINVSYKSGTREFHGNLFEFFRNSALDAKNFFDPPGKIAPFRYNQFGGTLGGPVVLPGYNRDRSKTFFFVSYEGIRNRQAQTYLVSVPTPEFRAGNFSAHPNRIFDPLTSRVAANGLITRDPFPGNIIPANRIDAVGRNIASLYPDPNRPGIAANYGTNPPQPTTGNTLDFKVDQNFSPRDQAFFRFSRHIFEQDVPGSLPAPAFGNTAAALSRYPLVQLVASYTRTISPNKINEFRTAVTRLNIEARHPNWGRNVAAEIGIPGVNVEGDVLTSGLTRISTGFEGLGDNGLRPAVIVSENYVWSDAFTWIHGAHTFKFGGEIGRRRYNLFQYNDLHGTMNFGTLYTSNPATPAGTGIPFAEVLLGVPQSGVIAYVTGTRGYRRTEYSGFAQDTWKVNNALTLNIGLRYEIFDSYPWTEVGNRMSNFVPERNGVFVVGSPELPSKSVTNTDFTNVGPRFGFAYKLGARMVLRGGYGLFYSSEAVPATSLGGNNPPFVGSVAYNNNQNDFAGARRASQGFDRPAGVTFSPIGAALQSIDPNFRSPYAQQWNFGIQRDLPGQILFSTSYVGTSGKKLVLAMDLNQPRPGPGAVAPRRPYPLYNSISWVESGGSSIYHSLQVSAEKRMTTSLGFLASYTWAHGIDNGDFLASRQNLYDLAAERGSGNTDLRHRLVVTSMYALPFGRGQRYLSAAPGWADAVIGGWQVNGISNIYSGLPFTPSSATNTLNGSGGQRPDRIGDGKLDDSDRSLARYFDITAFRTPGPFLFGNSGRNILYGPGTVQFDLSAMKNFRFSERRRLEFRSEFFNILNTPQFNNPNSSIGSTLAGVISAAGSKQTFQRTSRQIQLALKLYF
jgi:hypothetical protein